MVCILYFCIIQFNTDNVMLTIKPIKQYQAKSLGKYIHRNTSEPSMKIIKNDEEILVSSETGMYKFTSTDFSTIESSTLLKLMKLVNASDLGNILKLSILTKKPHNMLYNTNNQPHINSTLQTYLGFASASKFSEFKNRLVKIGVLHQTKEIVLGHVRAVYLLNPSLSRKSNDISEEVVNIFSNFTELNQ